MIGADNTMHATRSLAQALDDMIERRERGGLLPDERALLDRMIADAEEMLGHREPL